MYNLTPMTPTGTGWWEQGGPIPWDGLWWSNQWLTYSDEPSKYVGIQLICCDSDIFRIPTKSKLNIIECRYYRWSQKKQDPNFSIQHSLKLLLWVPWYAHDSLGWREQLLETPTCTQWGKPWGNRFQFSLEAGLVTCWCHVGDPKLIPNFSKLPRFP